MTESTKPMVAVRGLTKRYPKLKGWWELLHHPLRRSGSTLVLEGIDFTLAPGEALGLLGPNGAGKSTLLKVIAGLVLPDAGAVEVAGHDVATRLHGVRENLGYALCEERSFYWRLTGRQNLRFFAALDNLFGAERERRVDEALERVGMIKRADKNFRDLSTGMKQRLAIARALLNRPRVLLVDEPSRSLDPGAAMRLRRHLRTDLVEGAGVTMILATHDLPEAREVADRILLLDHGKIAALGPYDEVRPEVDRVFAQETEIEDEDDGEERS